MWGEYGSTSQDTIQFWFLITALICVPLMLFPKPLYEIYCSGSQHKRPEEDINQYSNRLLSSESLDSSPDKSKNSNIQMIIGPNSMMNMEVTRSSCISSSKPLNTSWDASRILPHIFVFGRFPSLTPNSQKFSSSIWSKAA